MADANKLRGKRVFVSAGAQGIGYAISCALLEAGCDVFVHYYSSGEAALEIVKEAAKANQVAACGQADLSDPAEAQGIVERAVAALGGLDVLVNNAGALLERRILAETDSAFWYRVMALNLGSIHSVTRAAVPHLVAAAKARGGASIINLSSLAGRKGGGPGSIAYSSAKGAVLSFTRTLATELGPSGIRVNALAPGLILGSQFHAVHTSPDAVQRTIAAIPLGRAGTTRDVARAAVFLAGEFDGFITGATIDINGGSYSC